MYAIIHTSRGVSQVLIYHERKIELGAAELLSAGNFLEIPGELGRSRQYTRFENLADLNQRAVKKTLLATLAFHPEDREKLNKESLTAIAKTYIDKIGFGKQPYLVFQHNDTAHPHLHILTSLIRPDGTRINTQLIGAAKSNVARKELEQVYGLIKGDKKEQAMIHPGSPAEKQVSPGRLEYGKSLYKPGIAQVVAWVTSEYRFTSLVEFNALLSQYRVTVTRGKQNGGIWNKEGLIYRMLDKKGKPIGMPVKASSLASKPTLANLEKKMGMNLQQREMSARKIQTAIRWTLAGSKLTLDEFAGAIQKENITLVKEQDRFIYINHRDKTVFEEKNLGEEFTRAFIEQQLALKNELTPINIRIMNLELTR